MPWGRRRRIWEGGGGRAGQRDAQREREGGGGRERETKQFTVICSMHIFMAHVGACLHHGTYLLLFCVWRNATKQYYRVRM